MTPMTPTSPSPTLARSAHRTTRAQRACLRAALVACALGCALTAAACVGGGGSTGFFDPDAGGFPGTNNADADTTNGATIDPDAGEIDPDAATNNSATGTNNANTSTNNAATSANNAQTSTNNAQTSTNSGTTTPDVPPPVCADACTMLAVCDLLDASGFASQDACEANCDGIDAELDACLGDADTCDDAARCFGPPPDPCAGVVCDGADVCDPNTGQCGPFVCTNDAEEPNGTLDDATPLDLDATYPRLTLCGSDVDVFAFTVPAGDAVMIDLGFEHARGDIDARLMDARASVTIGRATSSTDDERLSVPAQAEDETYTLLVAGAGAVETFYTLTTTLNPPGIVCRSNADCPGDVVCDQDAGFCDTECRTDDDCSAGDACDDQGRCVLAACIDDPGEPNATPEQAAPLAEGVQVEGAVCNVDDDWFAFDVPAGGADVYLHLVFEHAEGDLDMFVRDSDGQTIRRSESTNDDEALLLRDLAPGAYSLRVYSPDRAVINTYTLGLTFNPDRSICATVDNCGGCFTDDDCGQDAFCDVDRCVPRACTDDPGEPNDDQAEATLLSVGRDEGFALCGFGDSDWFAFEVTEPGTTAHVALDFEHALGDIDAVLRDANGDVLARGESGSDDEVLVAEGLAVGAYALRVYTLGDAPATPYAVTLTLGADLPICARDADCAGDALCSPARLCRASGACDTHAECADLPDTPACADDAPLCVACAADVAEPNDATDAATPLDDPNPSVRYNTCGGGPDVYAIDLEAGRPATVTVLFDHSAGDIDAELLAPDLTSIEVSDSATSNERFDLTPTNSGTHYLVVEGYQGAYNTYRVAFDQAPE